ncbi:MAG: hypothetical protein ACR2L2_06415 [Acidobacteriota bacterium]
MTGGAIRVVIDWPGITHIDFSDEPFWDGSMTPQTRPGKLETIADTRAWVRVFFDGTVRGDWDGLRRLAGKAGQTASGVSVHTFGAMQQRVGR